MKRLLFLLLSLSPGLHAQTTMFTSDFNGNTGALVRVGDTDNNLGSALLGVTWTQHGSVTAVSGLTAIIAGNSGTSGGFAQLQGGNATYANTNNVYIGRNHNLDTNRTTSKRGFSFTFTLDASWDLTMLTILSGHTNNSGTFDQDFSSRLNLSLSGGTLDSSISADAVENYGNAPAYHTVNFALGGNTLGAGTYTVEIYQSEMAGAGAYAMYDGVTLTGNTAAPSVPAIASFTTSDGYLSPGQSATLSWQVTGADSLEISPDVGAVTGTAVAVSPTQTASYTLTATNSVGSSTASVKVVAGPARPNILFFLVDDMGANDTSVPFLTDAAGNDVPTAGNSYYRTPSMVTLASHGMKFTRAYAMPVCSPSRVSIMTGMDSARHRVTNWTDVTQVDTTQNSTPSHRSPAGWRTQGLAVTPDLLPKLLGNAGYRNIAVGKAHFGNQAGVNIDPRDFGFDVNIGGKETGRPGSYNGTSNYGSGTYQVPHLSQYYGSNNGGQNIFLTEAVTLEMNQQIEKSVTAGVPFFAYMSHYAVHDPYDEDSRFAANYPGPPSPAKSFATLIEGMDKSLGDIIFKLNALGVAEDTLIIFMSDNGSTLARGDDPRRGYKGQKYEGGTRVPMIVAWAARNTSNPHQAALEITPGSRTTDIVSITDIFPTLLATAGVPVPAIPLDGSDLSPYLRATPNFHRPQELLIHFPHDHNGAAGDYYSVFHQGDFKLIYNYPSNSYELYNLASDPHEDANLAASDPVRVMTLARKMAHQLNRETAQWPRFSSNNANDPYAMPNLPGIDLDGDGLDDNAEDPDFNGLQNPGETDPDSADTDSDGTRDGAEVKTGTDPLSGTSSFRAILSGDPSSGGMTLSWPSKPGTTYRIESSEQLAGDWQPIASQVPAASSGSVTNYVLPSPGSAPRMFYIAVIE
jgi:arylsulfatase A-like enzyme